MRCRIRADALFILHNRACFLRNINLMISLDAMKTQVVLSFLQRRLDESFCRVNNAADRVAFLPLWQKMNTIVAFGYALFTSLFQKSEIFFEILLTNRIICAIILGNKEKYRFHPAARASSVNSFQFRPHNCRRTMLAGLFVRRFFCLKNDKYYKNIYIQLNGGV